MPRPRTLNEREFAICDRLGLFRRAQGVSLNGAAKATGGDRSQIQRFELRRAPVRLDEALAFARAYRLSLIWLATGAGFELDPSGSERDLFSRMQGKKLLLSQAFDSVEIQTPIIQSKVRHARAHARFFERLASSGALDYLSESTLDAINEAAMRAANEGIAINATARCESRVPPISLFTTAGIYFEVGSVNAYSSAVNLESSPWKSLRERLRAVTTDRGVKAALAKTFGVTQQSVSQWLSEDGVPSADNALRLVDWVAAAEAQKQKDSGRAETRPEQATQPSKSNVNEKPKPGRKRPSPSAPRRAIPSARRSADHPHRV